MAELYAANEEWSKRPADERFDGPHPLFDLRDHFEWIRQHSKESVLKLSDLRVESQDNVPLLIGPSGKGAKFTNYGFDSLTQQINVPKGFVSTLPGELAAQVMSYKLANAVGSSKLLLQVDPKAKELDQLTMRAATTETYGRIWNGQIAHALADKFGDGFGDWHIPGKFNSTLKPEDNTKDTTTVYGSGQDMFVFLCDEKHDLELPGRRGQTAGRLSRGFMIKNSDVGTEPLYWAAFLYDYMCSNHIIWGVSDVNQIRIKHTTQAPTRWLEEIAPVMIDYTSAKASNEESVLKLAMASVIDSEPDKVLEYTAKIFGSMKIAKAINMAHVTDEDRPIQTHWDLVTGATAYARGIPFQNERTQLESKAGAILNLFKN
jgi:hypothetical protein